MPKYIFNIDLNPDNLLTYEVFEERDNDKCSIRSGETNSMQQIYDIVLRFYTPNNENIKLAKSLNNPDISRILESPNTLKIILNENLSKMEKNFFKSTLSNKAEIEETNPNQYK